MLSYLFLIINIVFQFPMDDETDKKDNKKNLQMLDKTCVPIYVLN